MLCDEELLMEEGREILDICSVVGIGKNIFMRVYTLFWAKRLYIYKNRQLRSHATDRLCHVVFWPLSTLRDRPIDILIWNFDIAGLAVDTTEKVSRFLRWQRHDLLLSVDLEPHPNIFRFIFDILIHACRAESIFNTLVLGPLHLGMLFPVFDL